MIQKITKFFDKLEDKTRSKLSRVPLIYALIGGIGVVLFWRGVWHIADDFSLNSFVSLMLGSLILLITGVFVSAFVGNRLIITGLSGEKKLTEKTKEEIETEENKIDRLQKTLSRIEQKVEEVESELHHRN